MGDWPSGLADHGPVFNCSSEIVSSGDSGIVAVAAGATAHTKGAWAVRDPAIKFDVKYMQVHFLTGSTLAEYLMDIGVGATGSEQVIISDIYFGPTYNTIRTSGVYLFPVCIPKGSQISARVQASTKDSTVNFQLMLIGAGFSNISCSKVDTYGADTSDSGGTSIDPGASANTKGAWVEITSGCLRPILGLSIAIGNQLNTARTTGAWLLDIGVGAAGSETVIIPDLGLIASGTSDRVSPYVFPFIPLSIPVGTRISARAQSTITDATDRTFDIILYGIS